MQLQFFITLILASFMLALAAPVAKVASSDSHQVSWGLFANGNEFTGIPIVLGNTAGTVGSLYLANTTVPEDNQTRLRFQFKKNSKGFTDALISLDDTSDNVNVIMFQSANTKRLAYGPKSADGSVAGRAGPWEFGRVEGNFILGLGSDNKARAVWKQEVGAYQVYFGGDVKDGLPIALEGSFL